MPDNKPQGDLNLTTDHDKIIQITQELKHTQETVKDIFKQTYDQMEKLFRKDDELQKSVEELRVCQAQKLITINQTINDKFNEIKDVFKEHCVEEENQCRECATHRDEQRKDELKEMKGLVKDIRDNTTTKSTFNLAVTVVILCIGALFTMASLNTNYISGHREKVSHIEEMLDGHEAPVLNPKFNKEAYGISDEETE